MDFSASPMLACAFSYNVMIIKNHHNKNPNIFASNMFGLKCCLQDVFMLKLSKTSSLQRLFDYDCVTLYQLFPNVPTFGENVPSMKI